MNKRIRELAEQCTVSCVDGRGVELNEIDVEQFAELIVRECADKVAGMIVMDKGYIPQDPHSQGWNSAVAYASKELKKRFGVEE